MKGIFPVLVTNLTECNDSPGNECLTGREFPFPCHTSVVDPLCYLFVLFTVVFLVLKVCKLSNADENVVLILARCLPHIVPNVLLNKREVRKDRSRLYPRTTALRKVDQQKCINVHFNTER